MPESIQSRLKRVQDRIKTVALSSGRDPKTVKLVAVSKTVPLDPIRAAIKAGVTVLGENYVQEAREKIEALKGEKISWHFIGHLQSNKAKYAVKLFDLIHSVDSLKLARELNKRANALDKVQKILIQVNISAEATKSGIDTEGVVDLVRQIAPLENLAICGLMTMPPYFNAPDKVRPYFRALRSLQVLIRDKAIPHVDMTELSMGMTGDFEVAIEEGATLVRIGTAIFGERR
ncbi:MAG: YggS family pyridoxal phosphate-dependent enzyme [Deltaproteobacteria bacterium]|nr:YggS family pyridoxal phosphate-dependent enzyme [Deltaproteobacteria bacterium]MBW2018402.1 YggS family pyridoxal phosphate-dependent enzyme [Deltaproteobacteria bacterium]MBW2073688.1 YggS family pyridoxal phosphate-dependent enzyme [Deltaproteobacteria bacterium]RLB82813.1 MAG: YggS family pyridoxal phosphate-dependent enzyme [Deltaproteobacteria bacterium]